METELISKSSIIYWYEKLKYKPDNYSICPRCEQVYDSRFEACKCERLCFE